LTASDAVLPASSSTSSRQPATLTRRPSRALHLPRRSGLQGQDDRPQTVLTARDGESCGLEIQGPGPFVVFATTTDSIVTGAAEGELYANLCGGTRAVGAAPTRRPSGGPGESRRAACSLRRACPRRTRRRLSIAPCLPAQPSPMHTTRSCRGEPPLSPHAARRA
jgi:hypothetical protein